MRETTFASLGLALFLTVTACGRSSPAQPTPPVVLVAPSPNQIRIEGVVLNSALQGVPDSHVEVVQGPRLGASAVSDGTGRFALPGTFPFLEETQITLRASREGYVGTSKTIGLPSIGASIRTELTMKAIAPPADLTGSYLVTLTAAAECSAQLPETARSRTYTASIIRGEAEERFVGTLLVPPNKAMTFNVAVAATSATVWFGNAEFEVPGVVEDLGTGSLYIAGDARALASNGRIAGAIQGDWVYCPREAVGMASFGPLGCPRLTAQSCSSFGHQMVLTAR